MYREFKTQLDTFWHSYTPPIFFFFLKILFVVPKVSNSSIFQKQCFMKIISHWTPYKHCYFRMCLPTCQNGIENHDKAYFLGVLLAIKVPVLLVRLGTSQSLHQVL